MKKQQLLDVAARWEYRTHPTDGMVIRFDRVETTTEENGETFYVVLSPTMSGKDVAVLIATCEQAEDFEELWDMQVKSTKRIPSDEIFDFIASLIENKFEKWHKPMSKWFTTQYPCHPSFALLSNNSLTYIAPHPEKMWAYLDGKWVIVDTHTHMKHTGGVNITPKNLSEHNAFVQVTTAHAEINPVPTSEYGVGVTLHIHGEALVPAEVPMGTNKINNAINYALARISTHLLQGLMFLAGIPVYSSIQCMGVSDVTIPTNKYRQTEGGGHAPFGAVLNVKANLDI